MFYDYKGKKYLLNLIDTPVSRLFRNIERPVTWIVILKSLTGKYNRYQGHMDFNFEVSRSLAACQGTLLLVDAAQGIQAQTVANFYLAFGQDIAILPVINKVCRVMPHALFLGVPSYAFIDFTLEQIDLPSADPERVAAQIEVAFELPAKECLRISAKSNLNVDQILPTIIENVPA